MTSICLKKTPTATHQSRKQRQGTDPWSVWDISRWYWERWNRIEKWEHKTQVTETKTQISQCIEMTVYVRDVEKFSLCEFRSWSDPSWDAPPLALEENGKLHQVNVCLQMAEREVCVRKGFFLSETCYGQESITLNPCNIKLTGPQLVIVSTYGTWTRAQTPLWKCPPERYHMTNEAVCVLRWIDVWLKQMISLQFSNGTKRPPVAYSLCKINLRGI